MPGSKKQKNAPKGKKSQKELLNTTLSNKNLTNLTEGELKTLHRETLFYNCVKRGLDAQMTENRVYHKTDMYNILMNYINEKDNDPDLDATLYAPTDDFSELYKSLGKYTLMREVTKNADGTFTLNSNPGDGDTESESEESEPEKPTQITSTPKSKSSITLEKMAKQMEQQRKVQKMQMQMMQEMMENISMDRKEEEEDPDETEFYTPNANSKFFQTPKYSRPRSKSQPIRFGGNHYNKEESDEDVSSGDQLANKILLKMASESSKLSDAHIWLRNHSILGMPTPPKNLSDLSDWDHVRLICSFEPRPRTNEQFLKERILYCISRSETISLEVMKEGTILQKNLSQIAVDVSQGRKISNANIDVMMANRLSTFLMANANKSVFHGRSSRANERDTNRGNFSKNGNHGQKRGNNNAGRSTARTRTCNKFNSEGECQYSAAACMYPHICAYCVATRNERTEHSELRCPFKNGQK